MRSRVPLIDIDREIISREVARGCSAREIARLVGRHHSVVSRDIARHGGRGEYWGCVAGARAQERLK